jgi:hypothetical protein
MILLSDCHGAASTNDRALPRATLRRLTKPGDETVTLFADGQAVEIPVF